MELEIEGAPARGLRRYVRLVTVALGLRVDCSVLQWERPVGAYVALAGRLRRFPDRDVALIWDEEHGWAMAVEARAAETLTVLRYLGHDVLPEPRVVAGFSAQLFSEQFPGQPDPPAMRGAQDTDDLASRLAGYARSGT